MIDPYAKLSRDLIPILQFELGHGNEVVGEYEPAGTECPYAVVLRDPLNNREIERQLTLPAWVEYWSSTDPHYAIEAGYYSKQSKHAIAGPIPPAVEGDQGPA